jgi:hypothetical protein
MSSDSASRPRTSRERVAPSAAQTAVSCSRRVHCAIISTDTLTQAMTSVKKTAAPSSQTTYGAI